MQRRAHVYVRAMGRAYVRERRLDGVVRADLFSG